MVASPWHTVLVVSALSLNAYFGWLHAAALRHATNVHRPAMYGRTIIVEWLLLALVLTGKGMQALQEAGWLATTPVAFPRIDWLGVFPSQQSLIAQALILLIVIVAFMMNRRGAVPGT